MPRVKGLDSCMFCLPDDPCEAHQPKAKSAKQRKSRTSKPSSDSSTDLLTSNSDPSLSAVSPTLDSPARSGADVAAAMKAAAQGTASEDQALIDSKKRTVWMDRKEYDAKRAVEMEELRVMLVVLEPILHPDEKKKWASLLGGPSARAQRWKERRNATGV